MIRGPISICSFLEWNMAEQKQNGMRSSITLIARN